MLAYATIDGERVTVHNIRNFDYRTETDFTPAYYDKTFDLRQLDSVDLVAVYWMGPAIAHIMLSFGFAGERLSGDLDRGAQGAGRGLFDRSTASSASTSCIYVVADERDVIRVRTNYRKDPPEDVYLYRAARPGGEPRGALFLEYMRKINALREQPEFYNSLTTNCTSNIWLHARVNPGHVPYSWKMLVSGYVPEYLYEAGRLDTSVPVRRAAAAQPRQRARAGRGQGGGLLAADPDDRPSPALMREVTGWLPLGPIAKPVAKPKLADSTRAWCPRGDRTCNAI